MRGLAGRETSFFGVFRQQNIFKTPSKNVAKIAEQGYGTRVEIIYVWGSLGKFATWELALLTEKITVSILLFLIFFFFNLGIDGSQGEINQVIQPDFYVFPNFKLR
jgi:hypothetical protein